MGFFAAALRERKLDSSPGGIWPLPGQSRPAETARSHVGLGLWALSDWGASTSGGGPCLPSSYSLRPPALRARAGRGGAGCSETPPPPAATSPASPAAAGSLRPCGAVRACAGPRLGAAMMVGVLSGAEPRARGGGGGRGAGAGAAPA